MPLDIELVFRTREDVRAVIKRSLVPLSKEFHIWSVDGNYRDRSSKEIRNADAHISVSPDACSALLSSDYEYLTLQCVYKKHYGFYISFIPEGNIIAATFEVGVILDCLQEFFAGMDVLCRILEPDAILYNSEDDLMATLQHAIPNEVRLWVHDEGKSLDISKEIAAIVDKHRRKV